MHLLETACLFFLVLKPTLQDDIKGFDDTIIFDIDWPGKLPEDFDFSNSEGIVVISSMQEKYKCVIPNVVEQKSSSDDPYTGSGPLELIFSLFTQGICSFRLESYWDYEICHGRYIRQYHEDGEGKKIKVQEYTLGKSSESHLQKLLEIEKQNRNDLKDDRIPYKKIENLNVPYYKVVMENGTACDLNQNKPRMTKVLYACHAHSKNEIYQIRETSTCEYEVIILTPLLCAHPKYKPIDTGELKINCIPLDGAYDKPYNLLKLRDESAKLRRNIDLKVELIQFDKREENKLPEFTSDDIDSSPVESFLKGKNCLYGGADYWKYKFCYGKFVEQFHSEKGSRRISINLGVFDKEAHLEWLKVHPLKRPKPKGQRHQLSHFYSHGDVCDKTGKPRQTEVRLKCLKDPANPDSVVLYLLEPKYCEYILGVESAIICNILDKGNEDGLIDIEDNDSTGDGVKVSVKL